MNGQTTTNVTTTINQDISSQRSLFQTSMNSKKVFSFRSIAYFLPVLFMLFAFTANAQLTNVTISDPGGPVSETAGTMVFPISFDAAPADGSLFVNYGGTATIADHTRPAEVTFFSGSTGAVLVLSLANDNIVEADETIVVTLSSGNGGGAGSTFSDNIGNGTLTSEDQAVISVSGSTIDEGSGDVVFTMSLSNPVDGVVGATIAFSDGTATAVSDYTNPGSSAHTWPSETNADILINVSQGTDDNVVEADETINGTLSALVDGGHPADVSLGSNGIGTISNVDQAAVTIANVAVSENGGPATVTLILDNPVDGGFNVDVSTADGTATTADSDYTAVTSATETFAGTASENQTFDITITGDSKVEADETVMVSMSNLVPATVNAGDIDITDGSTVTFNNDDAAVVAIVANPSANEGDPITFQVTMSNPSDLATSVNFSTTASGDAIDGTDYTGNTGQTLTFPANDNTTLTVDVPTSTDNTVEADESFSGTITALNNNGRAGVTLGTPVATGTIINDDVATVTINTGVSATEGGTIQYTVSSTNPSDQDIVVNFVSSDGSATTADTDYTPVSGTVTIPSGMTSTMTGATVSTTADNTVELDETLTVTISENDFNLRNVVIGGASAGTGTINNDDSSDITISDEAETEGTTHTFTVSMTNASDAATVVNFATADNTATTADSDYTTASTTVTIPAGSLMMTQDVTIGSDTKAEDNETYDVSISENQFNGRNLSITDGAGVGTINNDDPLPEVTLSASGTNIAENGGSVTITATLSAVSGQEVTVPLTISGTNEGEGTDFSLTTTITIPANDPDAMESVTLTGLDDTIDDDAETVILDIGVPTNATVGSPSQVTVTIDDDDDPPTVTINPGSVAEGGGAMTMNVVLSNASGADITLSFAASNGTAIVGTDLSGTIAGLTFTESDMAAGMLDQDISITITDDTIDEVTENFTVSVSGVSPGGSISSAGTGLGTITDNDGPPNVTVSNVVHGTETVGDAGTVTFTVQLSNASDTDVVLDFGTTSGTATLGSDFNGTPTPSSFTFTAAAMAGGTLTTDVTVQILDDNIDEVTNEPEDFNFTIAANAGNTAALGTITGGTGNITDDEGAPNVTITAGAETAEGGSQSFTVTLSHPSSEAIVLAIDTDADGSAAGTDFTSTNVTRTFAAGNTTANEGDVLVPHGADNIDEGTDDIANGETYSVDASHISGGPINMIANATGTIIDDDVAPAVAVSSPSATEGATADFVFSITNGQVSENAIEITVNTALDAGLSAAEANDFSSVSGGTVTFAALQSSSETFMVGTTPDMIDEVGNSAAETFLLNMTQSSGYTLTSLTATATGTINDDNATPTLTISDPAGSETAGTAVFNLSLSHPSSDDITINLTTTAGTATGGDVDFTDTPSPASVTFTGDEASPNTTPDEGAVTVTVIDDDIYEPGADETLTLNAALGAGTVTISDTGDGTIADNEMAPEVTVSSPTANEADGTITFTLTLADPVDEDVTVEVTTMDGTAEDANTGLGTDDYDGVTNFAVTFPLASMGSAPITQDVVITINDENIHEGAVGSSENFTLEIVGNSTGNASGIGNDGTGTITHDDDPPSVVLAVGSNAIIEDTETTTIRGLLIGNTTVLTVLVDVNVAESVAVAGTDYNVDLGNSTFQLSATPGATQTNAAIITPVMDNIFEETVESVTFSITGVTNGTEAGEQEEIIVITDSESAPVVNVSDETENEGTDLVFTIELGGAGNDIVSARDIILDIQTNGGTAVEDTDYTGNMQQVTIPAGSDNVTFTVTGTDDDVYEDPNGDEQFTVSGTLAGASTGTIDAGGVVTGTGTIVDTDSEPVIELSVDNSTIVENGGTATITATLTGATTSEQDITIDWTFSGVAADPADYSHDAAGDQIVISAGASSGTFTITAADDMIFEGTEDIIVDMTVTNGTEGTSNQITVNITDDEPAPEVSISLAASSIDEDATTTIQATIDNGVTNAQDMVVSLSYAAAAGNTTADLTHTDLGTTVATLTIPANTAMSTAETIGGNANNNDEPDEDFDISITGITNSGVNGANTTETLTLQDNDAAPTVTLSLDDPTITENGAPSSTDVVATPDVVSEFEITVDLLVEDADDASGDTADNEDYSITPQITIAVNTASGSTSISALSDGIYEPEAPETLGLSISSITNGLDGGSDLTLNIDESGSAPSVSIANATPVTEGGLLSFNVFFNDEGTGTQISEDVVVTFAVGAGTSANLIQGNDYTEDVTVETVTITAGNASANLLIATIDDALWEDSETLDVDVVGGTSANDTYLANALNGFGVVNDNDTEPTITLSTDVTINETATPHTVTATLSAAAGKDIDIAFALSGTAADPADYSTTPPPTTMITTGGVTATSTSFDINIVDDLLDENDETVIVDLSSTTLATVVDAQQIITIQDDAADLPPNVTVTVAPGGTQPESTDHVVTATLDAPSGKDITVNFTRDGASTATETDDYSLGSITILAGDADNMETTTLDVVDDDVWEGGVGTTESVIITADVAPAVGNLQVSTGALDAMAQFTVLIDDNEVTPEVRMVVSNFSIAEDGSASTITFNLVDPADGTTPMTNSQADVIVPLDITGDATDAVDYNITGTNWDQGNHEVTIPMNESTTSITFTSVDDNLYEGSNESAFIDVQAPTGANIYTGAQNAGIAILEGDADPVITINDASAFEDDGVLTFTVTSTPPSDEDVIVDIDFANNTAVDVGTGPGEPDYTSTTVQVTIVGGTASITGDVPLFNDNVFEMDETFDASISHAGATSYDAALDFTDTGVGTILNDDVDDDPRPTVTLSGGATIAEAGGMATITATLSEISTENVTVNLMITNGTAEHTDDGDAYDDYMYTGLSIVINSGMTTGTIDITAIDDNYDEGDDATVVEDLTVSIMDVVNGTDGSSPQAVNIMDDDDAPDLQIDDVGPISEAGTMTYTIRMTGGTVSDEDMTVFVSTVETGTGSGHAISDTDYTALSGASTVIAARTDTNTGTVVLVDDDIDEVDETFTLQIFGLTSPLAWAETTTDGTATITDDNVNDGTPAITFTDTPNVTGDEDTGAADGSITFNFELSNRSSEDVTIDFSTADITAAGGTDYTTLTNQTVTITAADMAVLGNGPVAGSIDVTTTLDDIDEFDETFTLSVSGSGGGIAGGAPSGTPSTTGEITDNDAAPVLTFDAPDVSALEDGGMLSFPFTLSNPSSGIITIDFSAVGTSTIEDEAELGHATFADDFNSTIASVMVPAGTTTGTAIVTVNVDATDEFDEELTISVSGSAVDAAGPNALGSSDTDIGIILNDDVEPAVLMSVLNDQLNEATPESTDVVFALIGGTEKDVTVDVVFNDGIAAAPGIADLTDDYTVTGSQVVITAGATQSQLTIASIDETPSLDEIEETIFVEIVAVTNGTESGGVQDELVRILDGDLPPVAKITGPATVAEGSGGVTNDATITITLHDPDTDAPTVSSKDVQVTIQDLGNVAIEGTDVLTDDFTINNLVVDITAGNQTGTTTITTIADDFDELNEDAEMEIASGVNEGTDVTTSDVTIDPNSAIVTITDDDNPPVVSISIDGNVTSTDESAAANIVYRVSVASRSNLDITVDATYDLGSATHPADEVLNGNPRDFDFTTTEISQFSFTAAEMAAGTLEKTVAIDINDDAVYEVATESVSIDLNTPVNATLGTSNATTNITNDDPLPVITVAQTVFAIDEDMNTPTEFIFANMDRYSQLDVQIDFTISGDAIEGSDYNQDGTRIDITSGNLAGSDDIEITVLDDPIDENTETVTYTVSGVINGDPAIVGSTYDTDIIDNELGPDIIIEFDPSTPTGNGGDFEIFEEGGMATLNARLVDPNDNNITVTSGLDITINLIDGGGSADIGVDWDLGGGSRVIMIPAGMSDGSIVLESITDTDNTEGDELAIVEVGMVSNGQASASGNTAIITLIEDNLPPVGFQVEFVDPLSVSDDDYNTIEFVNKLNATSLNFVVDGGEEQSDTLTYIITDELGGSVMSEMPIGISDATNQLISGIDVSGLADGVLTVTVIMTDDYGNSSNPADDDFDPATGVGTKSTDTVVKITTDGSTFYQGFSPNSDGMNDYWRLEGIDQHPDNKVVIFNRYGKIVWEGTGYNNNDVAFRGVSNSTSVNSSASLPDGSYFYVVTYGSPQVVEKGFIVIKR